MRQILIIFLCISPFFGFSTPYIQKGDIIDIVAPSYGCTNADLQKIKTELTKLGYKPRVSEHIFSPTYLSYSNTNGYRFRDLKRALLAEDSKVIWVVRGGYGAQELLEDLNDMPKPSHQKIVLGFSDATFLHLFLNQQWDWESVHAPALKFNTEINQKVNGDTSLKEITQFLENPVFAYPMSPMNAEAKTNDLIEGRVIGSNMSIMAASMGNFYAPNFNDKIVLLEDLGETPQKVRRNFLTLKGLDQAKAIIFGEFTLTNEKLTNLVLQKISNEIGVPCYKTTLFGHGRINKPLPLNKEVVIENAILKSIKN